MFPNQAIYMAVLTMTFAVLCLTDWRFRDFQVATARQLNRTGHMHYRFKRKHAYELRMGCSRGAMQYICFCEVSIESN